MIGAFAVWLGGFTFYTAVVVPIGTDVLGSSRTQGFITQQVTNTLNLFGGIAIFLMVVELLQTAPKRGRRIHRLLAASVVVIGLLWAMLVGIHPLLDALLEPEHENVMDEVRFYEIHRIYLWSSTIQWLVSWAWLTLILYDWTRTRPAS